MVCFAFSGSSFLGAVVISCFVNDPFTSVVVAAAAPTTTDAAAATGSVVVGNVPLGTRSSLAVVVVTDPLELEWCCCGGSSCLEVVSEYF